MIKDVNTQFLVGDEENKWITSEVILVEEEAAANINAHTS